MHRDGRAFCSVLLLPRAPDTAPRPLSVHTRPGRTPTARAERGHPGGPRLRPEPARPPSCQDGVRTAAEGAGRTGCGLGGCGPAAQTGPGSSRTRVSPEHRPPGEAAGDAAPDGPCTPQPPGPGEAPLWPPLCPAPAEARGGHRVRPHPARGRGQRGRVEDVGAGGPVTPLPQRRPSEAEGLRPSVTRDGEITQPDRPCGQKREPVLEPGVSAECPGWSGRGRGPPREDGPPGGSGPGPQGHGHHCSHTACTSPGPWAARARACRAAGPPTAACTILAARPGLR